MNEYVSCAPCLFVNRIVSNELTLPLRINFTFHLPSTSCLELIRAKNNGDLSACEIGFAYQYQVYPLLNVIDDG